ncbi:MAG: hypothetical protein ACLU3I_05320 [Acutalibacteraceae bacterium]
MHKMLVLFNLTNLKLLIGTTVITFAVYAVFYAIVYRVTSNSYYLDRRGRKGGCCMIRLLVRLVLVLVLIAALLIGMTSLRGPGGLRQLCGDRRAADRP